jgi:hypothetical protein
MHVAGVLPNHAAELLAPWFVFGPRLARRIAGAFIAAFQLTLIASGNLSFLNWLTVLPALACFDDELLERAVPARWRERAARHDPAPDRVHGWIGWAVAALVAVLSVDPVLNLLSPHQRMNTSFGAFALVNTYAPSAAWGRSAGDRLRGHPRHPTRPTPSGGPTNSSASRGSDRRPHRQPVPPAVGRQVWFAAMSEVDGARARPRYKLPG